METQQITVDPNEVAKFEAMAAEWWDPNGKFATHAKSVPAGLYYRSNQRRI